MNMEIVPIIATLSIFIGAPAIVFGAILGMKWIKYRERALEVRRYELDVELQKLRVLENEQNRELLD